MNIQQNSWGISLGLVTPVLTSIPEARKCGPIKPKPQQSEHKKICLEIRELIKEKILNGYPSHPIRDLYNWMSRRNLVNRPEDGYMTYHRFSQHAKKVYKEMGVSGPVIPDRKKEILELFNQGLTEKEIATNLCMEKFNVYLYLVRFGLTERRPKKDANVPITDKVIKYKGSKTKNIKRLYKKGYSMQDIAEMLVTIPKYVREVLVKSKMVDPMPHGRSIGSRNLTVKQ